MSGVSGAASTAAVNNQLAVGGHNGVDLETLFMSLGAERANTLDGVIQGHAADMKQRNDEIAELNEALQWVRSNKGHGENWPQMGQASTLFAESANTERMIKVLDKNGVKRPSDLKVSNIYNNNVDNGPASAKTGVALHADHGQFKNAMDTYIENIKTAIDSKSSSSQLDMIKMQGLINKRNQTVEMLTNLVQKFAKTKDSIIGNMR